MNLEKIKKEISLIDDSLTLNDLKEFIIEQITLNLDKRENFMYRDYQDYYLYAIYFEDGTRTMVSKGCRAYEIFTEYDDAYRIETRTKELFPEYDLLMIKEDGVCKIYN